ncbi:DUF2252 domain-containing protein [Rhodococcus sp. BP-252]|uniref:DUF2252 domain-containing protein n=1 Tax=Rhodococcoides kyotonense TaxID=398843 RepID=A0A177YJR2_9NOCA|nr:MULTISPECIES: DUF2252 domain-containing protein [Rhodococcus]MBY6410653.1 DUF2252 domain-containing protein [Rhodococcus sp. BP-320]MBY6415522.1 DUF2252 domain-containing protein [Rhodococcus sp. BP-321]MBY6420137.1 DUF2252 domain-containing protein [Rhodococcus sp. BP-324]MBY6425209.1 DUF2252 domain-containing protein [Rhodococcus sp. BP-323]MBY6430728.1 DUF2252 domain-containing protein [Rhodococcus sp. BP-322]
MTLTLDRDARRKRGKTARRATPLESLAEHRAVRRDPVALLEQQAATRVPDLVPIRYGRMAAAEFPFFRGAALVMADDLSRAPNSGIETQLCGDAHLSNFGVYATPERRMAFDINDFDETHPGPFEWDVKRLAASLAIAAESRGFSGKQRRRIVRSSACTYRETIRRQAELGNLAVWYSNVEVTDELESVQGELDPVQRKRTQQMVRKARSRDNIQALAKLTEVVDGRRRIIADPPLVVPIEDMNDDPAAIYRELETRLQAYRSTFQQDKQVLFDSFRLVQFARKVVGVGSVGTRAWILLMVGADETDPLFLQAKEAQQSVIARYWPGPAYDNEGRRVVDGQRLMQASSDIFLGWQRGADPDGATRDFYLRQLRDGKGSAVIEAMEPSGMELYGQLCGKVLAYAHARSGDRVEIAGYLGSSTRFEDAITDFAEVYAVQNAADHAALVTAIDNGRVVAHAGI